jgi:hypothetical protein
VGCGGASLVVDSAFSVGVDSLRVLMSSTRRSTPKSVNACAGMGGDAREDVGQPALRIEAAHLCGLCGEVAAHAQTTKVAGSDAALDSLSVNGACSVPSLGPLGFQLRFFSKAPPPLSVPAPAPGAPRDKTYETKPRETKPCETEIRRETE